MSQPIDRTNCLRCSENKATVCTSCANELAGSSQPSAELNGVLEALGNLYEDWVEHGPSDEVFTQERMTKLMRLYDDWLG